MDINFQIAQVSEHVWSILEEDTRRCYPLSYLITGEDKVLLIDTGCGCGNIYFYIRQQQQRLIEKKKIIVVNTHNHPEQTGGNFRFSTVGKLGLSHMVEDLCASGKDPYYTKLMNSNWHWQINQYKVTRWLKDGDEILLGNAKDARNVVQVIWTPGHTPDSLVLWYPNDNRLFIGDLFYRFADIMLSYEHTNIKDYESSIRRILSFVMKQREPKKLRYSAAKNDTDNECLPAFKHFHRFILSVLAGTHIGFPLRIDEAEGWRFETRDKAMRIILGRDIVKRLNQAREKAQQ
ncbi:metallo-beta-lactamase domain protein [Necator americanus]|uniref:Metallo-beta-lactamase domain protein n=1 Tax=Necator americanus TaxID=51031 RepID=W2SRK7_NECAM|nr:metallo-beta-lactamase domain protein [Necator americanus]ETN71496.1 metallo-beta-lactamase domain protein [Necator americanus]